MDIKKHILGLYRTFFVSDRVIFPIFHILTDLKPYTAEGYLAERPVKKEKILTTSQALNLLKQRGYVIKDDVIPIT